MMKSSLQILAIYELGRLLFFLGLQANLSGTELSFGWYIAAPLLCMPFILIFFLYKYIPQSDEEQNLQKLCLLLFIVQKAASTTGFLLFVLAYVKNIVNNFVQEGAYFIENIPYMLIFFAIDVILCFVILIKNIKEKSSEG